jgi:hypothetical protein
VTSLRTVLLLLAALGAAAPAPAAGRLAALDVELGAETQQFAPTEWNGRPAVSAFTLRTVPGAPVERRLHQLVLDEQGWRAVGHWPLPDGTRYVEPLRLPGRLSGWLLLVGNQWQVALPEGDALTRRALCACDTIYSHGGAPDPADDHFVADVDGDGVDEVLLPYSAHLEIYRIAPLLLAPEPIYRIRWHPDGTSLPLAGKGGAGFRLPSFSVSAAAAQGRPALVAIERERVLVSPLPPVPAELAFALDAPRRALLERRTSEAPLPASLSAALTRLGERRFASAAAFLNALAQGTPTPQTELWAPHLLRVLTLARSELPVLRPAAVPLAGLGAFREQDDWRLLGAADMDGDGVLDVLHAKLLDAGSALSQHNELRWYRGRLEEGRLAFAPPSLLLRSDAGSFAEVVRLRRDGQGPLALLTASTEVNLGSIMKALASQSVTLEARVVPWQPGALGAAPVAVQTLTYGQLRAPGRRAMFLFADLNGDGWRDYLLNPVQGELALYLSAGAPAGLERPALVQAGLVLPSRPERVLIADLDGDGREELVLRYRADIHGALGTRLRLLRYEGE